MSRAREEHVHLGFADTPQLALEIRKVVRAVERGLGPPTQRGTLCILKLASKPNVATPITPDGVLWPRALVVGGVFFMTRETELAATNVRDLHIEAGSIFWKLTLFKVDPTGRGATRSWGCTCAKSSSSACPFCWLRPVVQWHRDRGSSPGEPFFQDVHGKRLIKAMVVALIEFIAHEQGEYLQDGEGRNRFGGHTLRVTGAQHLAMIGLALILIQLMGRWGGSTVVRYVADAPLGKITQQYMASSANMDLEKLRVEAIRLADSKQSQTPGISEAEFKTTVARLDELAQDLGMLRTMVSDDFDSLTKIIESKSVSFSYVRAPKKQGWHKVAHIAGAPPKQWRTVCGWPFTRFAFVPSSAVDWPLPRCGLCNRVVLIRQGKEEEAAESADDTESSGHPSSDSSV